MGDYAEWSEDERQEWLLHELASKRPLIPTSMPMSEDVREVRRPGAYSGCHMHHLSHGNAMQSNQTAGYTLLRYVSACALLDVQQQT